MPYIPSSFQPQYTMSYRMLYQILQTTELNSSHGTEFDLKYADAIALLSNGVLFNAR